jgi:hypothetical protein
MQDRLMQGGERVALWSLLACLVCTSSALYAYDRDPKALLREGAELARQERFDEALTLWQGILDELEGTDLAKAHRYLGVAFKRTGRLPEAWHYLSLYISSPSGKGDDTTGIWFQEVESQLQQTHVKVHLACTPSTAMVSLPASNSSSPSIDQPCPMTWWFTPGKHRLEAAHSGYQQRTIEIDVVGSGDSGRRDLVLYVVKPPPIEGTGVAGESITGQAPSPSPWPWVTLGLGVAMVGTGGLFEYLALDARDDIVASTRAKISDGIDEKEANAWKDKQFGNRVVPQNTAAIALFATGGAAVVGGIVWLFTADRKTEAGSGMALIPLVSPSSGGLSFGMTF